MNPRITLIVFSTTLAACGQASSFYSKMELRSAPACRPVVGKVDPVENLDLRWDWASSSQPQFNQNMATPMVADIDADGVSDLIFSTFTTSQYGQTGVLRVISGKDGSEIWSTHRSDDVRPFGAAAPAIYDLDRDGKPEILVAAKALGDTVTGLAIYDDHGALLAFRAIAGLSSTVMISVSDIDGDGKPEILAATAIGVLYPLNPGDWSLGAAIATSVLGTAELVATSPGQEIVTSTAVLSSQGSKLFDLPSTLAGASSASPHGIGFGRFDSDASTDFVIVRNVPLTVTLISGTTGTRIAEWVEPQSDQEECKLRKGTLVSKSGAPNVGDIDGDGRADVTLAGACRFYALRNTPSKLDAHWSIVTRDFSSAATGSSVYDFNGDGRVEALYNDELFFRILDGRTGAVLYELPNDNGTLWENPVVASLRAGEPASIILSANSYTNYFNAAFPGQQEDSIRGINVTGIRVIQGGDNLWMPTRTLWNQHLYTITNVLENLQLPGLGLDFISLSDRTRANIPNVVEHCVFD